MPTNPVNSVPLFPGRRRGNEPVGVTYHAKAQTDEDAARRAEALQKGAEAKILKAQTARASDLCGQCFPRNVCFICGAKRGKGMHGHMFQHVVRGEDQQCQHSEKFKTESTTIT